MEISILTTFYNGTDKKLILNIHSYVTVKVEEEK